MEKFVILIMFGIKILNCIALYKLFEKAHVEGWKAVVPYYNEYIFYDICNCKKWFWVYLPFEVIGTAMGFVSSVIIMFLGVGFIVAMLFGIYNTLPLDFFSILMSISIVLIVISRIISIYPNIKFIKCYSDKLIFKILIVIGSFIIPVKAIVLSILAFNDKYNFAINPKEMIAENDMQE